MADTAPTCTACKKTAATANLANLMVCAKCKTAQYCDRECQKADWKTHKKNCGKAGFTYTKTEHSSNYSQPHLKDLDKHISNPFTRLDQGTYLHDRSEKDVYKLLIDSFRIRQADDVNFENKKTPRSIYTGAPSSIEPFRDYLAKASARKLLPPWWAAEKQTECETFGESGAWNDLRRRASKQDISQHYGDEKMPMQLRMLAEAVYGRGTMGQDGSFTRKSMMQMEQGGSSGGYMSMLNLAG